MLENIPIMEHIIQIHVQESRIILPGASAKCSPCSARCFLCAFPTTKLPFHLLRVGMAWSSKIESHAMHPKLLSALAEVSVEG